MQSYLLLQSAFGSKEAYYKTLGFREEQGKIENVEDYLIRLESYMKLYGALVQVRHYDLMLDFWYLLFEALIT